MDVFDKLLDEIINNREYELYKSFMETEEDKRTVEIINTVAKRHNLKFAELLTIITEISALSQFKE